MSIEFAEFYKRFNVSLCKACGSCTQYEMCKGTACIAEKHHVVDAVVTVNITEHQSLHIPVYMVHGDTRRGEFPADVKATVQYCENLQALSVSLNTVGTVSVKRTHEIFSGVFNIPIATVTISNMVKRCVDGLTNTISKIKQRMIGSGLGHFDETGTRVNKKYGGFMMPPTVSIPIWISVPNEGLKAWSNAAYSQDL